QAISYAAYRMLAERYIYSRTAFTTLARFADHMRTLGYPTNNLSTDTSTPAGVGNSVYAAVSAWFLNDGARQTNGIPYPLTNPPVAYPDYPVREDGYVYTNIWPLATDRAGITEGTNGQNVIDINY